MRVCVCPDSRLCMLSSSPAANTRSLQHFIKQGCVAGAVEEPIDRTATVKECFRVNSERWNVEVHPLRQKTGTILQNI